MVGTEFKYSTYEKSTNLAIKRLEKVLKSVQDIENHPLPLSLVQIKALNAYSKVIKQKISDFETNLQKVIHLPEDEVNMVVIEEHEDIIQSLFIEADSRIEALLSTETQNAPAANPNTSAAGSDNSASLPTSAHVRLPKLDLITFDGSLS